MAHPMSEEVKSLHKKLVPANIIMAIVGFIAAICTLFMPWLDIRLSVDNQALANMLSGSDAEARRASVTLVEAQSSEEMPETDNMSQLIAEAIANLPEGSISIPINIYPMKLLSAATGDEQQIAEFIVSTIGRNGIVEEAKKIVNTLMPVVISTTIGTLIDEMVAEVMADPEIPAEDKALIQELVAKYKGQIVSAITTLTGTADTPSNPEKAKQEFSQFVHDLTNDEKLKEYIEEDFEVPQEDFDKVFDAFVEAGTKDGKFDIVYLLENIEELEDIINDLELSGGEQRGTGSSEEVEMTPDNSYDDEEGREGGIPVRPIAPSKYGEMPVISIERMEGEMPENPEAPEEDGMQTLFAFLNDPAAALTQLLQESGIHLQEIQPILLVVFLVLMALPALCWLLFAIFATLHIFSEKKTTRTWYVKFFGFWSAFFVILLNVAPKLILSLVGDAETAALLSAVSVKFLGSGLVVAICWAVLVLLGWFYCNPIKRKIRHTLRDEKYAYAHGYPVQNAPVATPTVALSTDDDEYLDEMDDEPLEEEKTEE